MSMHEQAEAGKGSFKRPREISKEQYSDNWDAIFKKDKKPAVKVCKGCHGEGGSFDAGHWYECKWCKGE